MRMPLNDFDKLINSKNADMKYHYVGGAGSTTWPFLQRFIKKTMGSFRYSWNGIFKMWRSTNREVLRL